MKKSFIASVQDEYMDRVEEVASRLRDKGCEIKRVMKLTGIITGRIDVERDLTQLHVEGIATIEKERTLHKRKN
jgi:hypothetical protein